MVRRGRLFLPVKRALLVLLVGLVVLFAAVRVATVSRRDEDCVSWQWQYTHDEDGQPKSLPMRCILYKDGSAP